MTETRSVKLGARILKNLLRRVRLGGGFGGSRRLLCWSRTAEGLFPLDLAIADDGALFVAMHHPHGQSSPSGVKRSSTTTRVSLGPRFED